MYGTAALPSSSQRREAAPSIKQAIPAAALLATARLRAGKLRRRFKLARGKQREEVEAVLVPAQTMLAHASQALLGDGIGKRFRAV